MSTTERDVLTRAELDALVREREEELAELKGLLEEWRDAYDATPTRDALFTTVSGRDVKPLYTGLDRVGTDEAEAIGVPGVYPFTRGPYATMYRTRLWTKRQFAGFATAEETNARYKYLLDHGQTGLSVAFDFPTLMGYDSDHARSLGEVGVCGVAISSLADMETLFEGIPLDEVSVSMTINGPAIILFCFYVAAAEKQGIPSEVLRGTAQNDILKEYQAQHAWVFPPAPALRCIVDMLDWCSTHAPKYNPISISGYHIREAGATAAEELAFTLSNGFEYVERAVARGLDVDAFAPRLSFFFDVHNDFFEEIAKLRAARRIWARGMRERYGARNPESWRLRTHAQTAGVSLTAQQAENNIVRVAYQAMAAALGGTQSLHTNSMDETLALPTEKAVRIALRTQQILAYESGVTNTIDPLAGSYFVESLTDDLEREALEIFAEIDAVGGVVPGIEQGWFQQRIATSAMRQQREIESGERVVVGVNHFTEGSEQIEIDTLRIDASVERRQVAAMAAMRSRRDQAEVERTLAALTHACATDANVVPKILDSARAYCTLYEIRHAMEAVFGAYKEPVFFCSRGGSMVETDRKIRVLVAKPGLDGHDRGAKVIASAFRDAGFEVIYTGLHQTPEMIVSAAVQEDVDVVAMSVLSGAHMTLFPRVKKLLDEAGAGDVLLTGGGIIPEGDAEALGAQGIGKLFGPGTTTTTAIAYIREWFGAPERA